MAVPVEHRAALVPAIARPVVIPDLHPGTAAARRLTERLRRLLARKALIEMLGMHADPDAVAGEVAEQLGAERHVLVPRIGRRDDLRRGDVLIRRHPALMLHQSPVAVVGADHPHRPAVRRLILDHDPVEVALHLQHPVEHPAAHRQVVERGVLARRFRRPVLPETVFVADRFNGGREPRILRHRVGVVHPREIPVHELEKDLVAVGNGPHLTPIGDQHVLDALQKPPVDRRVVERRAAILVIRRVQHRADAAFPAPLAEFVDAFALVGVGVQTVLSVFIEHRLQLVFLPVLDGEIGVEDRLDRARPDERGVAEMGVRLPGKERFVQRPLGLLRRFLGDLAAPRGQQQRRQQPRPDPTHKIHPSSPSAARSHQYGICHHCLG